MEQRISLITLGVGDLGRAMDFYAGLGWQGSIARTATSPSTRPAAWSSRSGPGPSWPGTARTEDGGGWGGITLGHNVRSPEEVDAVLEQARAAGGTVARAGAATFWGGYSGVFHDPDGNAWEVAHNPSWTVHDDGTVIARRPADRRVAQRSAAGVRPPSATSSRVRCGWSA